VRVFPDTGVLLAMIVFPRTGDGALTLAGEALALYEAGAFDLGIGQAVVDELDDVLDDRLLCVYGQRERLERPAAEG
jgi:hypothetical protein